MEGDKGEGVAQLKTNRKLEIQEKPPAACQCFRMMIYKQCDAYDHESDIHKAELSVDEYEAA